MGDEGISQKEQRTRCRGPEPGDPMDSNILYSWSNVTDSIQHLPTHLSSNYFSRYFWGYKTGILLLAALPQVLSDLSLKVQASSLSPSLETLLSRPLTSVVPVWTPQIQTPFSLTRISVIGSQNLTIANPDRIMVPGSK